MLSCCAAEFSQGCTTICAGPFNSWDRQVFVTDVRTPGSPSVLKQWDEISHNWVLANYNGQEGLDNDDGSCYYHSHHNVLSYSGNGMKVTPCMSQSLLSYLFAWL